MRILLITPYFPPESGWGPNSFYELGSALVRRGHEVVVLTGTPSYYPQGDLESGSQPESMMNGMKVIRVRTTPLTSRSAMHRGFSHLSIAAKFAIRMLGLGRFDASLVYSPPIFLSLSAGLRRLLRGTPSVVILQDLFPQIAIDLGLLRNPLVISILRGVERLAYWSASYLTVHSPSHLPLVLQQGGREKTTSVLLNWTDTRLITPGPMENDFRRKNRLAGKFVVSFGGILGFAQGLEVLVDAAALLEGEEDIAWVVVGDGVARERLVARAKELGVTRMNFLPMRPKNEYTEVLQASNVCLATLSAENHTPVVPSKLGTIMAAGRPLVAALNVESDGWEMIRQAESGIVVPAGDAQALAEAILQLKKDPNTCKAMGEHGRRFAEENLSNDSAAKEIENIVRKLRGPKQTD